MKIDVALNLAEIARLHSRELSRTTSAVFDVLRATSSMITALAHGALALWACENAGATPDAPLCS